MQVERFPFLRRAVHFAWRPVLHAALLPFRFVPGRPGQPPERPDLVPRTAEYNRVAERYYAEHADRRFLLGKPFSDAPRFGRHLIAAGVLVEGARLRPGDTVVDFGAGSCWLSHFLNRYGCRTISIDVSPTALAAGRELFERDPRTDWSLEPRFVPYDGRAIPLEDGSCDRILAYDAFHHVPNQRDVLAEMHRILNGGGAVAMSEPGRGHASDPTAIDETLRTGVLENELVVEDLAALAEAVGFDDVKLLVGGPSPPFEIPARNVTRFRGGRGFGRYWDGVCCALEDHHYLLLHKGSSRVTTERPGVLAAGIEIVRPAGAAVLRDAERTEVVLRVTNRGNTRWLHRPAANGAGWTRVDVRLHEAGDPCGAVIDPDWHRVPFERDVEPGQVTTVRFDLPAVGRPGTYDLRIDPVVEGYAWFADGGGSHPASLRVTAGRRRTGGDA